MSETLARPDAPVIPGGPQEGMLVEVNRGGKIDTASMNLNVGPAHPATHGVLRLVVDLDGEKIIKAQPVIGYMHRGFEKLAEDRDYRQIIALVNRHDWLSAFCNEIGVAIAVEKMLEMEVPDRAQWIRTMMCEWNRILNHLLLLGSYALELGALTPMFYTVREREDIQNLLEAATGGRLHYTYCRVGGLKEDLPRGFLQGSADMAERMKVAIKQYEDLLLGNEIFMLRTKNVGVLPQDVALDYGVTGCALHATGITEDVRISEPYAAYDRVNVRVPVGTNGDSFDRFYCLIERMKASIDIIEQVHDNIPAGPVNVKLPKTVKAPEGSVYVRTENPLGQGGYYLVSDGQKTPWRMKMRTPSFSNVQVIPYLLTDQLMADMIAILGSVFFVVGDVDR